MDITQEVREIKKDLKLIGRLEKEFAVKANYDDNPLLYCGIAESNLIDKIEPIVEQYFGKVFKPAGEGAFFKNLLDPFVKAVGGVRKEQTLFKKEVAKGVVLYCAFWPWGTAPVKTSVRIGLICYTEELDKEYTEALKGYF